EIHGCRHSPREINLSFEPRVRRGSLVHRSGAAALKAIDAEGFGFAFGGAELGASRPTVVPMTPWAMVGNAVRVTANLAVVVTWNQQVSGIQGRGLVRRGPTQPS